MKIGNRGYDPGVDKVQSVDVRFNMIVRPGEDPKRKVEHLLDVLADRGWPRDASRVVKVHKTIK